MPRPERGPVRRAEGLDPEISAQPRLIPDELALEASAEPELSVDPEDLGARFLSDAVEQGDFDPERGWAAVSLYESPAHDQPLVSSNFVAGNPIWEQTVDLETRTQGAADQLREPPLPPPSDEVENEPGVREVSLLDREDAESEPSQRRPQAHVRAPHTGERPPSIRTSALRMVRAVLMYSAWRVRRLARLA